MLNNFMCIVGYCFCVATFLRGKFIVKEIFNVIKSIYNHVYIFNNKIDTLIKKDIDNIVDNVIAKDVKPIVTSNTSNTYKIIEDALLVTQYYNVEDKCLMNLPYTKEDYDLLPIIDRETVWKPLGDKLSTNEKKLYNFTSNKYYTVRLDGKSFSKVVPVLKKLGIFEEGYSLTFETIMKGLALMFSDTFVNISYTFTQSDELTLLFKPMLNKNNEYQPHLFNGRIVKILTYLSSMATEYFNREIFKIITKNKQYDLINKLPSITFDARIGIYDNLNDAFELIIWRSYDCATNGVSGVYHMNELKTVQGLSKMRTIDRVLLLHKLDKLKIMTEHQKYGTLYSKNTVFEQSINGEVMRKKNKSIYIPGNVINNIKNNVIVL
jgi:tRNA(His) 5'-end guanylyltransferase